jgi:hypothetical protein
LSYPWLLWSLVVAAAARPPLVPFPPRKLLPSTSSRRLFQTRCRGSPIPPRWSPPADIRRCHWSIAPAQGSPFATGLAIDNTGLLSGRANFLNTATFTATVTDSSSPPQAQSRNYSLIAYPPLTGGTLQPNPIAAYNSPSTVAYLYATGGLPPVYFSLVSGSLPPGLRLNSDGALSGSAYSPGIYAFTVNVRDSYGPPEVITQAVSLEVRQPSFSLVESLPSKLLLNRPFSGRIIPLGGLPPYSFSLSPGNSLPPGLSLEPDTGRVSGTPTILGRYSFVVLGSDSTPTTRFSNVNITVAQPLGRNDSPATATSIGNGAFNGSFSGTISPFIDPPDGVPAPGDNDFYKLVSLGGATVHLETYAKRSRPDNPLDTVVEIVDGNGRQLSTCRQPGDTSANFTSPCINDDVSLTPQHVQDSALDFRVPGAADVATTFYIHVLDWRGDARPDMTYSLTVSGVLPPP